MDCVGTGIDLGASGRAEHLKLVGRWRESNVAVNKHGVFGIDDGYAGLDGAACGVLITEAQGVLLSETGLDDKEDPLRTSPRGGLLTAPRLGGRLVDGGRTCLYVLRQFFLRQTGNGVGVEGVPSPESC